MREKNNDLFQKKHECFARPEEGSINSQEKESLLKGRRRNSLQTLCLQIKLSEVNQSYSPKISISHKYWKLVIRLEVDAEKDYHTHKADKVDTSCLGALALYLHSSNRLAHSRCTYHRRQGHQEAT